MKKSILVVLLSKRRASAVAVQRVLTEYGCIIKTRLGIHDGVLTGCADTGLIILELAGEKKQRTGLDGKLKKIEGVSTKLVELAVK